MARKVIPRSGPIQLNCQYCHHPAGRRGRRRRVAAERRRGRRHRSRRASDPGDGRRGVRRGGAVPRARPAGRRDRRAGRRRHRGQGGGLVGLENVPKVTSENKNP